MKFIYKKEYNDLLNIEAKTGKEADQKVREKKSKKEIFGNYICIGIQKEGLIK